MNYPVTLEITTAIKAMVEAGLPDRQIARETGRSAVAVGKIRRSLNMPANSDIGRFRWSAEDIETLRAMFAEGKGDAEIGAVVNRSVAAIARHRVLLRLVKFEAAKGQVSVNRPKNLAAEADRALKNELAVEKLRRHDLKLATMAHLLDLKRAGHSPTRTELNIPSEGVTRTVHASDGHRSYCGSSSAMCEGA